MIKYVQDHSTVSLSISCVIYDTCGDILQTTFNSLSKAVCYATERDVLISCELHLINNNPNADSLFFKLIADVQTKFEKLVHHNGHGNIGYGRANNLAIEHTACKYHLILNPDVNLAKESIYEGIKYLESHPDVGLIAPNATNQNGEIEYLAKRNPTFFLIMLRGLNINFLNTIFNKQLNCYAYKDKIPTDKPFEIELASGCFMLCRTEVLKSCEGFSPNYFLYFEDFDLSRRIKKTSKLIFLPTLKIIHLGGNASKKGIKHIILFLKSALIFMKSTKNN
jgi:GT2 family glycosyltransferase